MKTLIYRFGWVIATLSYLLLWAVIWVLEQDFTREAYANWPSIVTSALKWVQEHSWPAIIATLLLALISLYRFFMKSPVTWEIIKTILNEAQKLAYPGAAALHEHRITLFKYKKFHWNMWGKRDWEPSKWYWPWGKGNHPWSGWLVVECRSGHTAQKSKTVFLAKEDGATVEGLCGIAWARQDALTQDQLPNLAHTSSDENIRRYVRRSFGIEEMVRTRLSQNVKLPRSIGAIPIMVNERIWGVLCLDSVDSHGVSNSISSDFTITIEVIQKLLEKM